MDTQNRRHDTQGASTAFDTEDRRRRELAVANFYLVNNPEQFAKATVYECDFQAHPRIGDWWARAAELNEEDGRVWTLNDLPRAEEWHSDLLNELIDASTAYIPSHIPLLEAAMRSDSLLREVIGDVGSIPYGVRDGSLDTHDVTEMLARGLAKLRSHDTGGWVRLAEAARKAATDYCDAVSGKIKLTLPLPLQSLQDALGGLPVGKLVMVQAITSGHKTTLVRLMMEHLAWIDTPTAYITLEDSAEHLAARTIASRGDGSFAVRQIMTGEKLDDRAMSAFIHAADKVIGKDPPLLIRHEALSLRKCITRIHEAVAKGAKAVGVDFFQLLTPDDPRTPEVAHWARTAQALQAVALELGVPLVVAVQATQEATKKAEDAGRAVGLGDIRGGSAISQAAFGVLSLAFPMDDDGRRVPGKITIIPRKWKTAQTGIPIRCDLLAGQDIIADEGAWERANANRGSL